ncbi:MAG: zf-HC2 domain-containing protein [Planctomycetes bacterium]|nr:zf-HC2 domain-containing protein [Planctomycetota bacterium]
MPHPQPHDLTALAYGLISGPEREQMLEHLASCDDCRASYDAAFDEQSTLRDVLVAEVRSGAVEARALERTLAAIAAQPDLQEDLGVSRPVGRLFRMPRALIYGLEAVAALLVISLGVFYLAQPGSPLNPPATGPGNLAAAPKAEAPAKLEGVVFASDKEGNKWERTGEVVADCWLRSDREQPATLSFENGLVCSFSNDAEFKLSTGNAAGVYTIVLRSGDMQLNAVDVTSAVAVETVNDDVLFAMPGSTMKVELRRAQTPQAVNTWASADSGSVVWVYQADRDLTAISMLKGGDQAEMDRAGKQLLWREAKGDALKVFYSSRMVENPQEIIPQMNWFNTQRARLSAAPLGELVKSHRWESGVSEQLTRVVTELKSSGGQVIETTYAFAYDLDLARFKQYLPKGDLPGSDVEKLEKFLPDGEYDCDDSDGLKVSLIVKTVDGSRTFTARITKDGKSRDVTGKSLEDLTGKMIDAFVPPDFVLPLPPMGEGREQSQRAVPGVPGGRVRMRVVGEKKESVGGNGTVDEKAAIEAFEKKAAADREAMARKMAADKEALEKKIAEQEAAKKREAEKNSTPDSIQPRER